ncbi:ATP-binding protein [Candidatus Kuenenia sp.]|uniref:two-component system sensor histidine kinase NtrB n=1 Tax=Candidatus Kuenenia sp. TaxID=2499824 RepID=UPI0032200F40
MKNIAVNKYPKKFRNELATAFEQFNLYTLRLEEAYNKLQSRVKEIDKEMEDTNARLKDKVQELDSLTKYLNSLLGSIHSGVIAINTKGEITTFNTAAEEILSFSGSCVVGGNIECLYENADGGESLLMEAIKKGQNFINVERKIKTSQGLARMVESSVSLIKDSQDNIIGAVEVFKDLSKIRDLEMRLRKADKLAAIGAMAASIAHEIRNPLNGIEGFSALLARDFDDSDPRKKLVKNIIQGTKNLNKTVTELLVFARPVRLSLMNSRISEILDRTLFFIKEDMNRNGIDTISIHKEYGADDYCLKCDAEKLQQVFLNLCLNAIQSMTCGGHLTVFTRTIEGENDNGVVQIGIKDTGVGIKKEVVRKIFDLFFTTKQDGTGIGLAIVNKIIEAHNGKIFVESEEGKGTTFYINLPINSHDYMDSYSNFVPEEEALAMQFA